MMYQEDPLARHHALRTRLTRGRYVRPDNSVRPFQQSTIDLLTSPSAQPAEDSQPVQQNIQPQENKKTLFSAIIDATVQVDKVTRQSVQTVKHSFEPPYISAMRTHRQRQLVRGFYAIGSLSFVFALVFGIHALSSSGNKKVITSVLGANTLSQNDATRNSDNPAENKPTAEDIDTYLVAPVYPRYLRIPSLHIEARIRRLGLDSKGAIATPNNINDAGWYDASVKPGEKDGASVIEGHVAGPSQHGIFWDINKLTYGDRIEIEKGSGEVLNYTVTKVEKVPANQLDMNKYISTEIPNKHDLKLVTAAGKYNIIKGIYDTRLVVYAQQKP